MVRECCYEGNICNISGQTPNCGNFQCLRLVFQSHHHHTSTPLEAWYRQFLAQVNLLCLKQREFQHPDLAFRKVTTFQVEKRPRVVLRTLLRCKQIALNRISSNSVWGKEVCVQ